MPVAGGCLPAVAAAAAAATATAAGDMDGSRSDCRRGRALALAAAGAVAVTGVADTGAKTAASRALGAEVESRDGEVTAG